MEEILEGITDAVLREKLRSIVKGNPKKSFEKFRNKSLKNF